MFLSLRLIRGGGLARRNSFTTAGYLTTATTLRTASSSVFVANRQHASSKSVMPSLRGNGIHTTTALRQAITPDSSTPSPPSTSSSPVAAPANISLEEYHELADSYLDRLVSKLEGLSEQREDVDVEYSVHLIFSFFTAGKLTGKPHG
jgi:hypothetical protein